MRTVKILLIVAAVALLGGGSYARHHDSQSLVDQGAADGPLLLRGSQVQRGRYLTAAADCMACHTVPGGNDYAGGVAFELPFGTIYSSNLTADPETGLGGWTDDEFVAAVRSGRARGGQHLYPAHPYTSYAGMARNDVLAIKAYLDSLPPIKNVIPANTLSFPYSQRGLMVFWNALYQPAAGYTADGTHDADWNRGAYLANALGHCGECHTPRNGAYALKSAQALSGSIAQGWKAYDITASGLSHWTVADLDAYLATGHAPGHGSAAGPMKAVVAFDTAQLTVADRQALVHYLLAGRTADPVAAIVPRSVADPASTGAALYAGACSGCHDLAPSAVTSDYGDLTGASTVLDPRGTNLLRLLVEGSPPGVGTGMPMPSFGVSYSAVERAALANYVLAQWGGLKPTLTANDAQAALH